MTIKTSTHYDTRIQTCPTCHKFFNPFGKRHAAAACCGNTWKIFKDVEITVVRDDGRKNGRFDHAPKTISRTSVDR
jgi:protein-arginine kinase activator protein McsA